MWNFPVDFFKCFEESYIFTYLWEGSIQKSYFDIHGIHYEKYMLDYDRKLIKHNQELEYEKRRKVVDLINIYEGKFNKIGTKIGKTNPLSKNWYESKRKSNLFMLEQLKANTENFFRTVSKTNSEDNMYTVFKSYTKYIKGKGYSKGFVPCNARGTNEFKDKKALAYLVNFFMSPEIRQFVNHYDLIFDEDIDFVESLDYVKRMLQQRDSRIKEMENDIAAKTVVETPADYIPLQKANRDMERQNEFLEARIRKLDKENGQLKRQLADLQKKQDPEQERLKKIHETVQLFSGKTEIYLKEMDKSAWLLDDLQSIPEEDFEEYVKAIKAVKGWAVSMDQKVDGLMDKVG